LASHDIDLGNCISFLPTKFVIFSTIKFEFWGVFFFLFSFFLATSVNSTNFTHLQKEMPYFGYLKINFKNKIKLLGDGM